MNFGLIGSAVNLLNQTNIWGNLLLRKFHGISETSELTSAGTHFNTVISGFIPQDNAHSPGSHNLLGTRKWGVIFMDGKMAITSLQVIKPTR
ncbi:MAG: hypothetical protein IPF54_26835 [Draconibacterium sp.]|nr:hypothetical protein [Draconibacterium sp.]